MKKNLAKLATVVGVLAPIVIPKIKAKIKSNKDNKQKELDKRKSRNSNIF